jgi:hypothetical protein
MKKIISGILHKMMLLIEKFYIIFRVEIPLVVLKAYYAQVRE